jgi:hypothetical protein
VLKAVGVGLDSNHDVFLPISMYQTADFYYLGDWFVALMPVGAALVIRRIFTPPEVLNVIGELTALFFLMLLLAGLWLLPLSSGHLHLLVAVAAMVSGTVLLYRFSRTWQDQFLRFVSLGMMPLCLLPVFVPHLFGVAENVLVLLLLTSFSWFEHVTLEKRSRPS